MGEGNTFLHMIHILAPRRNISDDIAYTDYVHRFSNRTNIDTTHMPPLHSLHTTSSQTPVCLHSHHGEGILAVTLPFVGKLITLPCYHLIQLFPRLSFAHHHHHLSYPQLLFPLSSFAFPCFCTSRVIPCFLSSIPLLANNTDKQYEKQEGKQHRQPGQ